MPENSKSIYDMTTEHHQIKLGFAQLLYGRKPTYLKILQGSGTESVPCRCRYRCYRNHTMELVNCIHTEVNDLKLLIHSVPVLFNTVRIAPLNGAWHLLSRVYPLLRIRIRDPVHFVLFWLLEPGSGSGMEKIRIRDEYSGSATLGIYVLTLCNALVIVTQYLIRVGYRYLQNRGLR